MKALDMHIKYLWTRKQEQQLADKIADRAEQKHANIQIATMSKKELLHEINNGDPTIYLVTNNITQKFVRLEHVWDLTPRQRRMFELYTPVSVVDEDHLHVLLTKAKHYYDLEYHPNAKIKKWHREVLKENANRPIDKIDFNGPMTYCDDHEANIELKLDKIPNNFKKSDAFLIQINMISGTFLYRPLHKVDLKVLKEDLLEMLANDNSMLDTVKILAHYANSHQLTHKISHDTNIDWNTIKFLSKHPKNSVINELSFGVVNRLNKYANETDYINNLKEEDSETFLTKDKKTNQIKLSLH